jgi:hypothetical protein
MKKSLKSKIAINYKKRVRELIKLGMIKKDIRNIAHLCRVIQEFTEQEDFIQPQRLFRLMQKENVAHFFGYEIAVLEQILDMSLRTPDIFAKPQEDTKTPLMI